MSLLTKSLSRKSLHSLSLNHLPKTKNQKQHEKRKLIISEIISTEKSYVDGLKVLIEKVYLPLKSECVNNCDVLSPHDLELFFGTILQLKVLHVEFLEYLEHGKKSILHCFQSIIPKLSNLYGKYSRNYENLLERFREVQKTNLRFRKFMNKFELVDLPPCQSCRSIFVTPVQRVPRYMLLIGELLKNTNKEDVDYEDLVSVKSNLQSVCENINEQVKTYNETVELMILESKIIGDINISFFKNKRKFVKQGILKDGSNPIHITLFNDIIMFCKPVGKKLRFNYAINLYAVSVNRTCKDRLTLNVVNNKDIVFQGDMLDQWFDVLSLYLSAEKGNFLSLEREPTPLLERSSSELSSNDILVNRSSSELSRASSPSIVSAFKTHKLTTKAESVPNVNSLSYGSKDDSRYNKLKGFFKVEPSRSYSLGKVNLSESKNKFSIQDTQMRSKRSLINGIVNIDMKNAELKSVDSSDFPIEFHNYVVADIKRIDYIPGPVGFSNYANTNNNCLAVRDNNERT